VETAEHLGHEKGDPAARVRAGLSALHDPSEMIGIAAPIQRRSPSAD
jgi:hypothetical protein